MFVSYFMTFITGLIIGFSLRKYKTNKKYDYDFDNQSKIEFIFAKNGYTKDMLDRIISYFDIEIKSTVTNEDYVETIIKALMAVDDIYDASHKGKYVVIKNGQMFYLEDDELKSENTENIKH